MVFCLLLHKQKHLNEQKLVNIKKPHKKTLEKSSNNFYYKAPTSHLNKMPLQSWQPFAYATAANKGCQASQRHWEQWTILYAQCLWSSVLLWTQSNCTSSQIEDWNKINFTRSLFLKITFSDLLVIKNICFKQSQWTIPEHAQ